MGTDEQMVAKPPGRVTRANMLKAGVLATGGALAGGLVADRITAESAPSKKQDAEILNFALGVERLQAAFYEEALSKANLSGELQEYATTVGGQEKEHVAFLEKALGSGAEKAQRFDFGDATSGADAFTKAARELEDLVTQAYNAGAIGLTTGTLKAAAKIASVEARHAAWIRDIAGDNPAPDAAEPETTAAKVLAALKRTGYIA
jgi:hypothetical protein